MKHIKEFEGLRGIMALWVVIGHWSTTADIPGIIGNTKLYNGYAVDVFIILSGFAITSLLEKRKEHYRIYIARRFLRIFPVYIFFLTISVLLSSYALYTWSNAPDGSMKYFRIQIAQDTLEYYYGHLAAHFVALHGIIPPKYLPNTDFAFLGQAWSISLEWQFYLIAPLIIYSIVQSSSYKRIFIAIIISIILVLLKPVMPVGYIGGHFHNFIIGILSYYLIKNSIDDSNFDIKRYEKLIYSVLFIILYLVPNLFIPYLIWICVIYTVCAKDIEKEIYIFRAARNILLYSLVQRLGNMAYSIYLSHMIVIIISLNILRDFNVTGLISSSALLLIMTILGTLVLSAFSYRFIEVPFHEFGKRIRGFS